MPRENVPLSRVANEYPLREPSLAERVANDIIILFRISLGASLGLTIILAGVDATFIWEGIIKPSERLVSEKVLMTIIGASIVQVGAALFAIVYALFRKST